MIIVDLFRYSDRRQITNQIAMAVLLLGGTALLIHAFGLSAGLGLGLLAFYIRN